MDRQQIFPGQVPLETDLLNTNKNVMTAIAKLAAAMFGTSTVVNGLAVTQTTVASMQVSVAAGEIYMLANMDGTAYSSLAADTAHQIMKQGISLDPQLLTLVAPGTVGFSVNYLIEATFTETDTTPVVLPYYNASNPSTAYSGPANAGTTNNTKRQGLVTLQAKAGTAATTGTQTTPAPDSGYVGIAVVTVAYGAVSVVNANISAYASAPFINSGMLGQVASLLNTPAQFDNSLKVASTAFVKQAMGNRSGASLFSTNQTLTAAAYGGYFESSGASSLTCQLPSPVGAAGGSILIYCAQSAGVLTVSSASGVFYGPNNPGGTATVVLQPGVQVDCLSDGTNWKVMNGSGVASLAASGYQKLPSGLILQWGTYNTTNGASVTGVTFPIAFPNAAYSCVATANSTLTLGCFDAVSSLTTSGFNVIGIQVQGASSNGSNHAGYFFAIGR